jgi:hypothetical protein
MPLCAKSISTKILTTFHLILVCFASVSIKSEAKTGFYSLYLSQSDDTIPANRNDTIITIDREALKSKVKYHARDSIRFDIVGERVYLFGKAKVNYEDIELTAGYMEVDWSTRTLFARGVKDSVGAEIDLPEFKQKEDKFSARTLTYNFDSRKGKITQVNTRQGEGFILGETVKKIDDKSYYIRKGAYTTCDAPTPHYSISSNKLKVIQDNKVVTGPAYLVIEEVPTPLMIPFGYFPTRKGRANGILFPSYGESARLGFFFKDGGYYFGIGDVVDFALTGDIYTLGSWAAKLNSNYAKRYRFGGNVSVSYSEIKTSERELPDFNLYKDFFIRWNHRQDAKARPGSNFSANVNAGSSGYYQNNISSANNYLANTFQSSVAYTKSWQGKPYSFSATLSHSQNTLTRDVSLSLPNTNFSINRIYPFRRKVVAGPERWYEKIGISYQNNFQNTIRTKDTLLFKEGSPDKFRYGMSHNIPISTSMKMLKHFTFSPTVTYNEKWYPETIRKNYDETQDAVVTDTVKSFRAAREFLAGASLNTRIYGMFNFRKGKIHAIRHVMAPTISYNYRPDFSDPAFGYYKSFVTDSEGNTGQYSIFEQGIYGGPASGKFGMIGFNLDNNLEMKVRQQTDTTVNLKKIKIFESLAASISYNTAVDSLRWSNLNINGRTTLFDRVNITFSGTFDPYVADSVGRRINKLEWDENNRLARFVNASGSVGFNLVNTQKKTSENVREDELNQINRNLDQYIDFSVPFNLAVNYHVSYTRAGILAATVNQTINVNGDVSITPKWKVTFSSGYDFNLKDLSYTSLGIYRDLHCWEMRLNWVPFGFQENYYFQINVKSSILQDLKLTKKNDIYDR